jgi:hypothetical protein
VLLQAAAVLPATVAEKAAFQPENVLKIADVAHFSRFNVA